MPRCEASRPPPAPHSWTPGDRRRTGSSSVAVPRPGSGHELYRGTLVRLPPGRAGEPADVHPRPARFGPGDQPGRAAAGLPAGPPSQGPAQLHAHAAGRRRTPEADRPPARRRAAGVLPGRPAHRLSAHPFRRRAATAPTRRPADAEPPRRIDRLAYRLDGEGFLIDKPQQVFLLDLGPDASQPIQLTDEPAGVTDPVFTADGRLLYVRPTGIDELTDEIAMIAVPGSDAGPGPDVGELLVSGRGLRRRRRPSTATSLLPGCRLRRHRRRRPDHRPLVGTARRRRAAAADRRGHRRHRSGRPADRAAGGLIGCWSACSTAAPRHCWPCRSTRTAVPLARPAGADRRPTASSGPSTPAATRVAAVVADGDRPASWSHR